MYYENELVGSPILGIMILKNDRTEIESLGLTIKVYTRDVPLLPYEVHQSALGSFLNSAVGNNLDEPRTISPKLEQAIVNEFKDVLKQEHGRYVYRVSYDTLPNFLSYRKGREILLNGRTEPFGHLSINETPLNKKIDPAYFSGYVKEKFEGESKRKYRKFNLELDM